MKARARFAAGKGGTYLGSVNWRIPNTHESAAAEQPSYAQQTPDETTPAYQLGKAQAAAALGATSDR